MTVILVVLDGWGIGRDEIANPIVAGKLTHIPALERTFPVASLNASGIGVGLPWGEAGNSEVGHLTLGAGKILYQHYPRISLTIRDGSFFENAVLKKAFAHARENNGAVNFLGLLTKGNTHASLEHLEALIEMGKKEQVPIKLHLFADGVDSPPHSIDTLLKSIPMDRLASLTGRYYAMDREKNWDFTRQAYACIMGREGMAVADPSPMLQGLYAKNLSESVLPPLRIHPELAVAENDALVFFNFREDSIRQLAAAFLNETFAEFPRDLPKNLFGVTFTSYGDAFSAPVAFPQGTVEHPLGWALAEAGKSQLRLAETYKYAHVTYFFNGYREPPYENEYRVLIPSLQTSQPEAHPEMMAAAVTDRLIQSLENQAFDFILANYANPDTIAHTGNYAASVKAVQVIDEQIGRLVPAVLAKDACLILTSDHGNVEQVVNPTTGRPETQHDPNPVPVHLVHNDYKGRAFYGAADRAERTMGSLADVAPTILEIMKLQTPPDMEGHSLLENLI